MVAPGIGAKPYTMSSPVLCHSAILTSSGWKAVVSVMFTTSAPTREVTAEKGGYQTSVLKRSLKG